MTASKLHEKGVSYFGPRCRPPRRGIFTDTSKYPNMAATESSDRDQIYGLTKECKNNFERILSTTDPGPCRDFVTTQYKSFRAWIATTGALAPLRASLNHRLREHGHIKLAVVELLVLVKDCLDTGE